MSYLRWIPPGANELYVDRVREVDMRLRRLESQRATMLQRYGDMDPTVYVKKLGDTAIPDLVVTVSIPTEGAWFIVQAGCDWSQVNPTLPGLPASLTVDIFIDFAGDFRSYTYPGVLSTATVSYYTDHHIKATGSSEGVAPVFLTPGDHTISLRVTPDYPYAGDTAYIKNRFIRGVVQG